LTITGSQNCSLIQGFSMGTLTFAPKKAIQKTAVKANKMYDFFLPFPLQFSSVRMPLTSPIRVSTCTNTTMPKSSIIYKIQTEYLTA